MKRWNQTSITWTMWSYDVEGCDRDRAITRIPVSDAPDQIETFVCTQIKAESQETRNIKFTLSFHGPRYKLSPDDREMIRRCLGLSCTFTDKFKRVQSASDNNSVLINVPLKKGEHFCERAIEFVDKLFSDMGIKDDHGRMRGNFEITQSTQVLHKGQWKSYKKYLHERYGLKDPHVYSSGN